MKKDIGKILIDLGKIIFATSFLGSAINNDLNRLTVSVFTFIATVLFITIGLILTKKNNK